jgi:putative DNA primase/helicase
MREPLYKRAEGRWRHILTQVGLPLTIFNGKHQPCPLCGGKDRFRYDDKHGRGSYYCSGCSSGTGIDLVMRFLKIDFKAAAERIKALIGASPFKPPYESEQEAMRQAKNSLWQGTSPVRDGDPVARYLAARHLGMVRPPALRYHPVVRYDFEDAYPAMLAMITGPDDRPGWVGRCEGP